MSLFVIHKIDKTIPEIEISDLQLWDNFRSGNKFAYKTIYENHVKALYDYGCKLTNDAGLVEDCIQDLFVTLWNRKGELEVTSSIRFYLISFIRRKIIKIIKNNRSDQMLSDPLYLIPTESSTEEVGSQDNRLRIIKSTISKLPRRQKEAIDLKFFHNLDYDEISDVMGISVESSYNLISKAIASLKIKVRMEGE